MGESFFYSDRVRERMVKGRGRLVSVDGGYGYFKVVIEGLRGEEELMESFLFPTLVMRGKVSEGEEGVILLSRDGRRVLGEFVVGVERESVELRIDEFVLTDEFEALLFSILGSALKDGERIFLGISLPLWKHIDIDRVEECLRKRYRGKKKFLHKEAEERAEWKEIGIEVVDVVVYRQGIAGWWDRCISVERKKRSVMGYLFSEDVETENTVVCDIGWNTVDFFRLERRWDKRGGVRYVPFPLGKGCVSLGVSWVFEEIAKRLGIRAPLRDIEEYLIRVWLNKGKARDGSNGRIGREVESVFEECFTEFCKRILFEIRAGDGSLFSKISLGRKVFYLVGGGGILFKEFFERELKDTGFDVEVGDIYANARGFLKKILFTEVKRISLSSREEK